MTSCSFIIRSISAAGICCSTASTSPSFSHPLLDRTFHPNWPGQLTSYQHHSPLAF
jgi:hypothetical protein